MKKLIFLLLFPVSVFSQTLQEVDFVAKGYYKVIVSDTLYSQHQNQKECLQQVTNLLINNINSHCEQPWIDVVGEFSETVTDSFNVINVESLTLRQVNWSFQNISGERKFSYQAEAYGDSVRFEYFHNADLIRSSTQIPANGAVHDTLINPPNDSLQIWIYGYWDKWVEPFTEIVDIALLDTLGEDPAPEPDPEPEQPDTTMSTYLHDTFTDTDGTSLTAHTPDTAPGGASWDIFTGGVADIQSNQASVEGSGTRAAIDAGVAGTTATPIEFLFEWTPTAEEDNRTWCAFRYQDSNNYWGVNAREPNGDVRIIETIAGVSGSPDHTFNYSFTEGQTYEFKVVLEDDSITIFIDGVQELTFTDSQLQSETGFGVGNANVSTPQLFDRIAVVDEGDGWPSEGGETLEMDKGSFTLSGKDLFTNLSTPLNKGTFNLTGRELLQNLSVPLNKGTFSQQGYALSFGLSIPVDKGTFSQTGYDLVFNRSVPLDKGSFTLDGKTINLNLSVPIGKGTFDLTGYDLEFGGQNTLVMGSGSFSVDGKDLSFQFTHVLDKGSFSVDGKNVNFNTSIPLEKSNFNLDGKELSFSQVVPLDKGGFDLTGYQLLFDSVENIVLLSGKSLISDITGQSTISDITGSSTIRDITGDSTL